MVEQRKAASTMTRQNNRLGIFQDTSVETSFVIRNSELVFARLDNINGKWVAWFYTKHLQKEFGKMKDALAGINDEFISYLRGEN